MPTCLRFVPALVLFVAAAPVSAPAQQRPPVEGTWVVVGDEAETQPIVAARGDASFRVGTMGSGWGSPLTLSREGSRLVLEYPFFSSYDLQAPLHHEFSLDGPEVPNELTIGASRTHLWGSASWSGDTLVVLTRQPVPPEVAPAGVMAEVRRALALSTPDTLVIVTTRFGVAGAADDVVRTVLERRR